MQEVQNMKMEKPPVEVSGVCAERGSDHVITFQFSWSKNVKFVLCSRDS